MHSNVQHSIYRAWRRKSLIFYALLLPLSWFFCSVITLRRIAFNSGLLGSTKLAVPVIVVGNITMGGSGKTPVVLWLAQQLQKQGFKPAIISRGYGGSNSNPLAVTSTHSAAEVGDEPLLLLFRAQCPVWVGVDRVAVGKALLEAHPECNVIISDDGLQHYRLQRTIEIAVVDAQIEHHQYLLPAGPLREPLNRLKTVDLIIANGQVEIDGAYVMHFSSGAFYNLTDITKRANAADFKQQSIVAIAGIGKPERFFDYLMSLGLTFVAKPFQDHYAFSAKDLAAINCDVLLMTEKDAVKCTSFAKKHYWALPIDAEIDTAIIPIIVSKLAADLTV